MVTHETLDLGFLVRAQAGQLNLSKANSTEQARVENRDLKGMKVRVQSNFDYRFSR